MTDKTQPDGSGDDDPLLGFASDYEAFQRLSSDQLNARVLSRVVRRAVEGFREGSGGFTNLAAPGQASDSVLGDADSPTLLAKPYAPSPDRQLPLPVQTGEMPTRLGDYYLIRKIGEGGMGVVWEAHHRSLGDRRFAIKTLKQGSQYNPRSLKRFQIEARILAQLDHDHIVPIHHISQDGGTYYYVMRFIEGGNLARLIRTLETAVNSHSDGVRDGKDTEKATQKNESTYPSGWSKDDTLASNELFDKITRRGSTTAIPQFIDLVVRLVIQVAEALNHAHEMGVIHRDIKPANLLLDTKGNAWVADFGLAQVRDSADNMTETGALVGTKPYMSPEQVMGTGRSVVDSRTDIYSLGVTLYELLTLTPAFPRRLTDGELLHKIQFEDPPPARQVDAHIPKDLETILMRSMRKRPDERYDSAAAMASDLRKFAAGEPIPRGTRPTFRERSKQWARTHRQTVSALAATAATTILAAFGLAWFAYDAQAAALQAEKKQNAEIQRQKDKVANERDRKIKQLNRSEGLRLAAHSLLQVEKNPPLAAMLGIKALEKHPGMEANNAILKALEQNHDFHTLRPHKHAVGHVSFNGDGTRLITTLSRKAYDSAEPSGALIWDALTGELLHELKDDQTTTTVTSAVYSPDNVRILTTSSPPSSKATDDVDGKLVSRSPRLWADRTYEHLATFEGAFLFSADSAVFDPMGRRVVLPSLGHGATIYDCFTSAPLVVLRGHEQRVVLTAFSPTGELVATASDDNTVRIWDAATGAEKYEFVVGPADGRQSQVAAFKTLTFRPDGQQLVTGSNSFGIQLWDLTTGKGVPSQHLPEDLAQYWPNGMHLLTYRQQSGRDVRSRFTHDSQLMNRIKRQGRGNITQAVMSPDGQWLAMHGAEDRTRAAIWNQPSAAFHAHFAGHRSSISDVAFSPDSRLLATASTDKTAKIWHLQNGLDRSTFSTRTYPPAPTMTVERTGKQIAIATADYLFSAKPVLFEQDTVGMDITGRIWMPQHTSTRFVATDGKRLSVYDLDTRKPVASTFSSFGRFLQAAINGQGDRVAAYSGGQCIMLWHPDENRKIPLVIGPALVRKLVFTPDGNRLVSGTADGYLRVWDAATGKELASLLHQGQVADADISPDGKRCVAITSQGGAVIWDLDTFQKVNTIPSPGIRFTSAKFTFDGLRIVLSADRQSQEIIVWNLQDESIESRLDVNGEHHVAVHPSKNEILIASEQQGVSIWDLGDQSTVKITEQARLQCGFSRDGTFLFATSEIPYVAPGNFKEGISFHSTVLDRWQRDDLTNHEQVELPFGRVSNFHVGFQGAVFVNLEHRFGIAIHDMRNLNPAATLPGHLATITDIAFSSNANLLISASHDRRVILWDLDSGQQQILAGHEAAVTKVAWSADDSVLLTGDHQGQVLRWNTKTGQLLSRCSAGQAAIRQLAVHPNSTQFMATTERGELYLHDLVRDQPIRLEIGASEFAWAEYSPDGSSFLAIPGKIKSFLDLVGPVNSDQKHSVVVVLLDGSAVYHFQSASPIITSHYDPDGERIVTLTRDGKITLRKIESRTIERSFSHNGKIPLAAALDPSGDFLAVVSGDRLTVIRVRDGLPWLSVPRYTPQTRPLHHLDPFLPGKDGRLVVCRRTKHQFRTVPLLPSEVAARSFPRSISAAEISEAIPYATFIDD